MITIGLIIILKRKLSLSDNCHSNVTLLISEAGKIKKVLMIRIVNDHIILTTIF